MAMNGNEGGSAYPPNPDVKSGSCLIAGFQPLTVVHPSYWNAYKTESGATFSIDMVRLKLSFINGKGEWLSEHAPARGFLRPPRRGVPNHEPEPLGEFEGACPLMHAPPRAAKPQARSDPKSRRTDSGTLSARPLFRR